MRSLDKLLLGALMFSTALPCACRSDEKNIAGLHAADVPVLPLRHAPADPTVQFPESFPLQVAVYWSAADEGLLGLTHSLGEMGVPFFVTRDLDQALRHHLVIIAPSIDGKTFQEPQIRRLTEAVTNGSSILAFNVFAGGLKPLFGFGSYAPSRRRYQVLFAAGSDPSAQYLNRPEERTAPLGASAQGDIFWTNGYTPDASATLIAKFDDGTAAVFRKRTGRGSTYLIGLSLQDVVLRSQINHDFEAGRRYVNAFEPGADIWMLFLRAWYESNEPNAVRLGTIPGGLQSLVLLSHDVDWENSFDPALTFADMEDRHHVKSSFLIQTKYVSDANSVSFFFGKDLQDLKQLYSRGFSIGSHSVIHSAAFNKFSLGDGKETLSTYRPKGTGFNSAEGATVMGEVRVSKELLDGQLEAQHTQFFRAGHLRVPPSLPEALQRCGYLFDSSFTAGDVLSNFPYPLPLALGFDEDSGLYEFPVTIEDEEKPSMEQRVDQILEVVRANAENGAVTVILIHPNEAIKKLAAEDNLLSHLPAGVGAADLIGFAHFWRARSRSHWTITPGSTTASVRLDVLSGEPVDGLTFQFARQISSVDGGARVLEGGKQIVLSALPAGKASSFVIRFAQ